MPRWSAIRTWVTGPSGPMAALALPTTHATPAASRVGRHPLGELGQPLAHQQEALAQRCGEVGREQRLAQVGEQLVGDQPRLVGDRDRGGRAGGGGRPARPSSPAAPRGCRRRSRASAAPARAGAAAAGSAPRGAGRSSSWRRATSAYALVSTCSLQASTSRPSTKTRWLSRPPSPSRSRGSCQSVVVVVAVVEHRVLLRVGSGRVSHHGPDDASDTAARSSTGSGRGRLSTARRCQSGHERRSTRPVQTGTRDGGGRSPRGRRSPPGVAKCGCGATVAALSTSSRNQREQSAVAKLVIVESPAKARTIGGYLGKDYVVESSIGHIRDLPNNAADTPAKIKDKPWGRLAVDVDNGFEPYYVVPRDKKSHIAKLKKLVKEADALYLATDEDREGEAIAWHLLDELKPPKGLPVHRMVFHEITKAAILAAVENPREINDDLVEAQEARRILDRLYGYEVSPGAVEEGHVRPLRRPRAVRRDPPGRRQGARADEVPRRLLLGHRRHLRRRHRPRPADVPRQALQRRRRPRRPRLRLRQHRRPQGQGRARPPLPRRRRVAGHRPQPTRRTTSARSSPSPTAARRTPPSAPPRCSRRPAASSA